MPTATSVLPSLDQDYTLNAETIAAFRRDGHVRLPALATRDEIAVYHPVIAKAVEDEVAALEPYAKATQDQRLFPPIARLWMRHEGVRRFAFARRFAKVAAELFGCRAVRMYHDGSMYKHSGGPGTPWHQDGFYMPVETDRVATLWMPLIDMPETMGTLSFASGSHLHHCVQEAPPIYETEPHFEQRIAEHRWPVVHTGAMAAGDATLHLKWTLHRVPPNSSGRTREAFSIIYVDADARLLEKPNARESSMIGYNLGALPPGSPLGDAINPVIYRAD